MLLLSRKKRERVVFDCADGSCIVVEVHAVDANRVVLGIEAPRSITVLREELLAKTPSLPSPVQPAENS